MTMPDVDAFFVHTMLDVTEAPAGSWDRGVGMTWISSSTGRVVPKLAYCAFAGRVDTPVPALGCPRIGGGGGDGGSAGGGGADDPAGGGGPDSVAADHCLRAKKLKRRLYRLSRAIRRARRAGSEARAGRLVRRRARLARRFRASWRECRVQLGLS
jgi:hypothetical protein